MSPKLILALGALAFLLYLGFSYQLRVHFPRIEVVYNTAVTGRISSSVHMGDSHYFFLNGKSDARYDFDAFTPALPAAGQSSVEQTSQDSTLILGEYLHMGDSISKDTRSTGLTVWRGQHLSQWTCPPAEARP
jgi:hypothetical protein